MSEAPAQVREFAAEATRYIYAALRFEVDYGNETLPVVDHYLRTVPRDESAALALVIATTGAYFGEVVRRHLGGTWDLGTGDPNGWRLTLPSGLSFAPAGLVAAAIIQSDELEDLDATLDAPPKLLPNVEFALSRMANVTMEEYYSLCGRFDTLEHIQDVLLAVALQRRQDMVD